MTESQFAARDADFEEDLLDAEPVSQSAAIVRPVNFATSPLLFFRQFLASPKAVGSIIPTSQVTIDALLDPIDWSACRTFVEYGPGTGVFTRGILERGPADMRVIAIDPNPVFVDHLRATLPDRRLTAVQGSAEAVEAILERQGGRRADYILSGLPFSTLPSGVDAAIVGATERALVPGGAFLVYQYSLGVLPLLTAHFAQVDVSRVWRCIPPVRLMRATKAG